MRSSILILLPATWAMVGCAGTVSGSPEESDAEPATTTSAIVSVERTTDTSEGAHAEASARFIRVTSPSSATDALRAIGASVEIPARGTCASIASLTDAPSAQASLVELLDVGDVALSALDSETHLVPRQLPDVTDVVTGVVYARATESPILPAAATYEMHVSGGDGLEPIDTRVTAPSDPSDIHIAGEDAGMVVASEATVDFAWTADRADDVVFIDVRPSNIRCVAGGSAHATISTMLLDETGTLVVHRLRREPLVARGLDSGEIRFDFARAVSYVRR